MHEARRSSRGRRADDAADFEAVKSVLDLIRAHSTIRFAALPFFLAALAILTKTYFEPDLIDRRVIAVAALGLTLVAGVIEIVLSRNLLAWWTAITPILARREAWRALLAHRDDAALSWARWALLAPYVGSLVFWMQRSLCLFLPPPHGVGPQAHATAMGLVAGVAGLAACLVAARVWRGVRAGRPARTRS